MLDDVRAALSSAGDAVWTPEGRPGAPIGVAVADLVAVSGGWLALGRAGDEIAVAPVIVESGRPRRARAGDGVFAGLARSLAEEVRGLDGRAIRTGAVLRGDERSLGDHTNELVVVGERAVVKLFSRTSEGPQPGVDLPAHLAAVGFTELPAPIGSVWWRGALVATVSAFVPDAADGWEWYVAAVGSAAAGETGWLDVEGYAVGIGELVGRLHRALATPSPVMTSPVGSAEADRVQAWRDAADVSIDAASAAIDGPEGERLRAAIPAARDAVAALDDVDRTPVMRIHGDLHVGQILRTADGTLLVNDFDGNPLAPTAARDVPQAPARDVAWMLAAIDHVGRVVMRRRPGTADAIEPWIERAREAFLGAYRRALGDRRELLDERLLGPFSIVQEMHEFLYSARFAPAWRYVPDAALPAALARLPMR